MSNSQRLGPNFYTELLLGMIFYPNSYMSAKVVHACQVVKYINMSTAKSLTVASVLSLKMVAPAWE